MFKTPNILFVFFCLLCTSITAQDLQQSESFKDIPYTYTNVQIDSMIGVLRDDFHNANYDKIIDKTPDLISNARDIEYKAGERGLISVLGNAFIQIDDTEKASEIFNEALVKAQQQKDTLYIGILNINLGNTYFKEDHQRAITYFENAYKTGQQLKDDRFTFISLNNLSELYVGIKDPDKAQYYVDKTLPMALKSKDLEDRKEEYLATIYHVQGGIFLLKKQYNQAIEYLLQSMEIGKDGVYQEETLLNNYKYLIEAYENTEQYKVLNDVRKEYEALRDKRYDTDNISQQQLARSKFNLDQYEQRLKASELEKQLAQQKASSSKLLSTFSLIVGSILLLFVGLLLYMRRKRFKLLKDLKAKNQQYLEAKEKSEKLTQAKTQLFSTISHELRTPLYGIIGLSSILLKDPKLKDNLEDLTSLKFSADYLLALVNDVLNLNKLESQTGQLIQNSNFNLETLIHSITQSFEFINQQNNNVVYIDIDPTIPKTLVGDQVKISQILMNLVSNASKFTQDGRIDVIVKKQRVDDQNISLLFMIKDTGIGIPEEQQEKIFEEFTQGTNLSEYEGTGLGLPIVNKILAILGSKIMFESTYGKGTTFSCVLSFSKSIISQQNTGQENVCIEKLQDKKILIVDDNKINQLVTQKVLEQHGMSHGIADNGLDAIEKVKEQSYDAILMDVNMPVMNGLDSSREIRNIGLNTPIIALTAINAINPEKDFGSYGIDDAIVKPYRTERLLELLVKYIN
ncbi:response regulator [Dokdonia pacifica]|uniref:histidine kinase n=1 Tax=Dokdonia pacifica TaxID=1627892 RepID=A0A238W2Z0_9FLAO|nr:response regulator [Dokdonia pacifica]SNR40920.1 Tetratricopeptide repeat-containing protein [Dokdonia pacifica]